MTRRCVSIRHLSKATSGQTQLVRIRWHGPSMPVATEYSRLSDTLNRCNSCISCEVMQRESGSPRVGDIEIEGGRSWQGARGPDWDSRDASFDGRQPSRIGLWIANPGS
eukprot:2768246-Rhodomonas_salina.1